MPAEHCFRARSASADRRRDRNHDGIDDLRRQFGEQQAAEYPSRLPAKILPLVLGQCGRGDVA